MRFIYVDDILIVSDREVATDVAGTLESKWTTTPVSWSAEGVSLAFDGFEVDYVAGEFVVHQRSYVRELLKQYSDITGSSTVPSARDLPELNSDEPAAVLLKLAQALTGQLLWLAGRTRPDLSYAVSIMCQGIVQDPAGTVARRHLVLQYLRYAPQIGLKHGVAPETYGKWGQLQWRQTAGQVDLFSDASFLSDDESWDVPKRAGSIVMWNCGKQPLLSAFPWQKPSAGDAPSSHSFKHYVHKPASTAIPRCTQIIPLPFNSALWMQVPGALDICVFVGV